MLVKGQLLRYATKQYGLIILRLVLVGMVCSMWCCHIHSFFLYNNYNNYIINNKSDKIKF
jgi:hypothetical protein